MKMKNKYSISDVKVGWTVQLNSVAWDVPRERFQGMWGKVETIHGPTLTVLLDGDMRVHFPTVDRFILDARPPEPAKDPFAVGEWVVCVASHWPARTGDVLQVECEARSNEMFIASSWLLHKAYFRPATPEEIAAHLEKTDRADQEPLTSEDCELKITPAVPLDADAKGDGKITFTVAGYQMFIGQSIWASSGFRDHFRAGDELVVLGARPGTSFVAVRKVNGSDVFLVHPSLVRAYPHEWQFGDQASHPIHGNVLVIDTAETTDFICASPSDPEIYIDPAELTFIRRTDLGE